MNGMKQNLDHRAVIFDFFDVFQKDAYKAWLAANDFSNIQHYAEASRSLDIGSITSNEFLWRLSELSGRDVTWESMGYGCELAGGIRRLYFVRLHVSVRKRTANQLPDRRHFVRCLRLFIFAKRIILERDLKCVFSPHTYLWMDSLAQRQ